MQIHDICEYIYKYIYKYLYIHSAIYRLLLRGMEIARHDQASAVFLHIPGLYRGHTE
jgi:hypothetical protein